MGAVLGKIDVEVPAHIIVHRGANYQIWKYPGQVAAVVRAADLPRDENGDILRDEKFSAKAFPMLAKYIGVFGSPQNKKVLSSSDVQQKGAEDKEQEEAIAMTAPVVTGTDTENSEKVAMTAPVVMTNDSEKIEMTAPVGMSGEEGMNNSRTVMKFLLPSKFKTIEDAPVPTNEAVKLEMVEDGRCEAVLGYSGDMSAKQSRVMAEKLVKELEKDGIKVIGQWTFQGYNPPFTLPWLRRNEVHVPVDPEPYVNVTEDVTEEEA